MNLFALTSNPGARIVRFPLTKDLQDEITAVFDDQSKSFLNGIVETVEFDGRYRPDEGELLVIKNFPDVDGLVHAVKNPIAVELFDPKVHSLNSVKALFTGHGANGTERVLIQLFESRRLIATKGIALFFSGDTFQRMSDAGLTLDTKLLAVLENGDLKFQSFHFLRRVFDVSENFNEATAEEIKTFANHPMLAAEDAQAFMAGASAPVRRKITLILQSGVLENFTAQQIVASAQTFKIALKTAADGRIVLPTNGTELRRLLRFLDEDYYESPLSQTHFVSNSKRVAD
jgi:Domain of unknown function (DUF4868)